ncbi:OsmC family protein [Caballeronia sp. LjRoot29]|uniref:OsmC family protein n=1 Tax=Caballeronia sp. LjRoot29 TaxID=3342315 RepID=UPI003ECDB743
MTKHHKYTLQVVWTGDQGSGTSSYTAYSRDHLVRVANKPAIEASSDPAFRGSATRHNPEELFVASLSSCHMLWYLHLCAVNGIAVTGYVDDPLGTMEETAQGSGRFTDVVLRPQVTIGAGGDVTLAARLHEEAHKFCFIANSVNFPVRCEPTTDISTV